MRVRDRAQLRSCGRRARGEGACVFARCRAEVAEYQRSSCDQAATAAAQDPCLTALAPCATAGELCKFLACVDHNVGNASDNRVRMVGK